MDPVSSKEASLNTLGFRQHMKVAHLHPPFSFSPRTVVENTGLGVLTIGLILVQMTWVISIELQEFSKGSHSYTILLGRQGDTCHKCSLRLLMNQILMGWGPRIWILDKFHGNCHAPYSLRCLAVESQDWFNFLFNSLAEWVGPTISWPEVGTTVGAVALKGAAKDI